MSGAAPPTEVPSAATLAIRDVTVIPMNGGPNLTHRTVLISGQQISSIVAADAPIPDGVGIIEGDGRFLFPGLVDAHVHLRRADAAQYLADGVLTVRNMWGHSGIRPLIADIERGNVAGPAVVSLSPGIDGSPPQWPETELLNTPADAEALVARLAGAGWKTLKVYQSLSLASFDAVSAAAKRHGVEFAGHVPTAVPIEHALTSGMRSIEHLSGYDRRLSASHNGGTWGWSDATFTGTDALLRETVAQNVWNVPTMAIYRHLAQQHPADMRARVIGNRRRFVQMLYQAGAHLAAGTDAGIDVIPAAGALEAELEEFAAAGIPLEEVLAIGTRHGGELLREPGLGTIVAGAPARLLLLDGDPTRDLAVLRRAAVIVRDGRILTRSEGCAGPISPSTQGGSSVRARPRVTFVGIAAAAVTSLACGASAPADAPSVAGTYNTAVSVTSSSEGCSLPVQNNPTVVQTSNGNSVVMLTHAGTTYGGELKPDLRFTTQPKTVVAGGVSYAISITGKFTGSTLDASVTLDYGSAPACHVVVRWLGARE
ncbi:MAG: amidohydrolase family protein [Gemmatimonadota bacterium]